MSFMDDKFTLAAGTSNGWVVFYDVRGKPQPFTSLRAYAEGLAVFSTSLDNDNFLVFVGGYNGKYNNEVDHSQQDLSAQINKIKEEKRLLESSLEEVSSKNSILKAKIVEINGTHAELSKELHSVQSQLVGERSRCAKLEAQIAKLQNLLESM